MRPDQATLPLLLPPLCNLAVKIFLAAPVERHMRVTLRFSTLQCRRAFTAIGFVGSAAALLVAPLAARYGGAPLAALSISLSLGFSAVQPSGFKANYLDAVSPANSGVASGIGNMLASGASYALPLLVSYLLRAYASWDLVCAGVAVGNCLAAAFFVSSSTVTPVDAAASLEAPLPGKEG